MNKVKTGQVYEFQASELVALVTKMKGDGVEFSLGFMKSCRTWPFGSRRSFGSPGAGGSLGFADPASGIGYAYVTSQMGTSLTGDPREVALRDAVYSCLASEGGASGVAA